MSRLNLVIFLAVTYFLEIHSLQAAPSTAPPKLVLNPSLSATFTLAGFQNYVWDGLGGGAWVQVQNEEEVRVFGMLPQEKAMEASKEWSIYIKSQFQLGNKVVDLGCTKDSKQNQDCFAEVKNQEGKKSVHRMWFGNANIAALVIAQTPKDTQRGRVIASAVQFTFSKGQKQ